MEAGRFLRNENETQTELEPPSNDMARSLRELGLPLQRMRTGTPPRLALDSIDFSGMEAQLSDDKIQLFSYLHEYSGFKPQHPLIKCHITYTNPEVHDLIWENVNRLPELYNYSGGITEGPRYCPSIEKKLIKFPDRDRHLVWLEPEGLNTNVVYPNGLATGLPEDAQVKMIKGIKGLENAKILSPAYIVSYDSINPQTVLKHTLETK